MCLLERSCLLVFAAGNILLGSFFWALSPAHAEGTQEISTVSSWVQALLTSSWVQALLTPSWVQALGSVAAICVAIYLAHLDTSRAKKNREYDISREAATRRLKARSLTLVLNLPLI